MSSTPMMQRGPSAAWMLGLAGLLPFVGLTGASFGYPGVDRASAPGLLAQYGAIILAFVGALHWGYAVRDDARGTAAWVRYGWSVVPSLVGWWALQLPATSGLRVLAAALVACLAIDHGLAQRYGSPSWLMPLRCVLTSCAAACLIIASYA